MELPRIELWIVSLQTPAAGLQAYPTAMECLTSIVANEGAAALWAGAGWNVAQSLASSFVLFHHDTIVATYVQYAYGRGAYV